MADTSCDWRAAIDLGARLGLIGPDLAAQVRDRLAGLPEGGAASMVGSWLGISPDVLADLDTAARAVPKDASDEQLRATIGKSLRASPTSDAPRRTAKTMIDEEDAARDLRTLPPDAPSMVSPSAPPPRPEKPRLPERLGPYEVLETLGEGALGLVVKARHAKLGSLAAVKVPLAGIHASQNEIERFHREASAVAKMGKHPNIVAVHDLGYEGELAWFAMEYVEGEPLSKRLLESKGGLAPEETARVMEKVARALHFAHQKGVIHRDLKPDNILMRTDGEPQVADFGLVREVADEEAKRRTGAMMGTPAYMPPEQASGDLARIGPRSDVYGLGAVLYEMLTRVPPHRGRTLPVLMVSILRGEIVRPRQLQADLPRDLETICMKCLELSPDRRYESAEALAEDLARFQRGEPVRARPVGRAERAVRWVRRNPVLSAACAAVLVALFGGIGLSEWRASSRRGAEYAKLVSEAESRLSPLSGDRVAAIRALVDAEEKLRAAQDLMAAHGGRPLARRYEVNRLLGEKALEGNDYTLARLAFSVCRSVDARRAEVDGLLEKRIDESEQKEAMRRKKRIESALDDIAKGLGRAGRERGAPDFDDYVFEVSGYRDEQTVHMLGEALTSFRQRGTEKGEDAHWTQEESQTMTFAFRVLGRLGLESAVDPLGGMMGVLWDHPLVVECGTALCNTRSANANGPLLLAARRLGVSSSTWFAIEHSFARVRSPEHDLEPRTAAEFIKRGVARSDKGDVDGAIADYNHAIGLDPKDAVPFNDRGIARKDKGDIDGAIEDYTRAIELDPKCAPAFINRGVARKDKGDVDGAIADYNRAIEIDFNHAAAFVDRGIARNDKGDVDGAIEDYTRAIGLDSKLVEAFVNRGVARQAKGDLDGAIEDFARAIELNPKDANALVGRGTVLLQKEDLDGVIQDCTRAIDLNPKFARAFALRGNARQAKGDLAGAITDWESGLKLEPQDPCTATVRTPLVDAHYNLACMRSLASAGKDAPNAQAKPVDAAESARLRDDAFEHLREALKLGYADAKHLESDADLSPLHDDPRWAELLQRLSR